MGWSKGVNMTEYRVTFEELYEVFIEAENADEATEKFMLGEYDNVQNLATNFIEAEEAK